MSSALRRYNRPNQSTLRYRVATYPGQVDAMTRQLLDGDGSDDIAGAPPRLDLAMPGDLAAAMIKAWAVVGDVLSFYQERIANEGYLATCRQPLSLDALAAQVGYRPRPALAATTWLAYTLRNATGAPRRLDLPRGARLSIQSLPLDGQLPQTFENDEAFEARVEWNALQLWRAPGAGMPGLAADATLLRIDGLRSTVAPGALFLLRGLQAGTPAWMICRCLQVEADRDGGASVLHFSRLGGSAAGAADLSAVSVHPLDEARALFGAGAARWSALPDSQRLRYAPRSGGVRVSVDGGASWNPHGAGLPGDTVHALLALAGGVLLAGTGSGVWRSAGPALPWQPLRALGRHGCYQLLADTSGNVFAACDGGLVLRSNDGGDSWMALGTTPLTGTMRALAFNPQAVGGSLGLLAAGDSGVFFNPAGADWVPAGNGLPGYDPDAKRCSAPVRCLWVDQRGASWAGAQDGVYNWNAGAGQWRRAGTQPALATVHALAGCADGAGQVLFAATASGLWRSRDDGASWTALPALAAPVFALAIQPGAARRVLAGGADGMLASDDLGQHWQATDSTLLCASYAISCAALDSGVIDVRLRLALSDRGLALGPDAAVRAVLAGQRWHIADGAAPPAFELVRAGAELKVYQIAPALRGPVGALSCAGPLLAMALPFGPCAEQEWPGFHPVPGHLDLERVHPGLAPGDWLALLQPDAPCPFILARVQTEQRLGRSDFGYSATVSRLTLSGAALAQGYQGAADPLVLLALRDCGMAKIGPALRVLAAPAPAFQAVQGATLAIAAPAPPFRAHHTISLTGPAAGARLACALGGVYARGPGAWQDAGLAGQDVRVLLSGPHGVLHAGTADGVFALNGGQWTLLAPLAGVRALLFDGAGALYAGAAGGLFLWSGSAWSAAGLAAAPVCALCLDHRGALIAATDGPAARAGVWLREPNGSAWLPLATGLAGCTPSALLAGAGGIYLGTLEAGVWRMPRDSRNWQALRAGLASWQVRALGADGHGALGAGTAGDGVYRLARGRWQHAGLAGADVRALVAGAGGDLYAAAWGDGVHRRAAGAGWQLWPAHAGNALCALAQGPDGMLLAGAAALSLLTRRDASRLALTQAAAGTLPPALWPALRQGWLSPSLRLALQQHGVTPGPRAALRIDAAGLLWLDDGAQQLLLLEQHDGVRLYDNPALAVARVAADGDGWLLYNARGEAATLRCDEGQLRLEAAAPNAPDEGEIATIAATVDGAVPGVATLRLAAPLARAYDPARLRICANVARASHGETVAPEVLGSGNAALGYQQFTLNKAPLAYFDTPAGPQSTLAIRIRPHSGRVANPAAQPFHAHDHIHWTEAVSLGQLDGRSRAYTVRTDHSGRALLTFGNGVHGARLPSAGDNVIASYRVGGGVAGNLAAGQLSRLRNRPAGVDTVSNPVPATGGLDAEAGTAIRRRAAPGAGASVVTLADYAAFALARADVAKGAAQLVRAGGHRVLQLTVAGPHGAMLDPDSLARLRQDLDAQRAGGLALHVANHQARPISVAATILVAPGADQQHIEAALRGAMAQGFGFAARALGQPLSAFELLVALQRVPGVLGATLDHLGLRAAGHGVAHTLHAAPARWDPQAHAIAGAELLTLAHADLTLTIRTANE